MYYWDVIRDSYLTKLRMVSVVVRRMYYWDGWRRSLRLVISEVSVVVRRMYYWDWNGALKPNRVRKFQ